MAGQDTYCVNTTNMYKYTWLEEEENKQPNFFSNLKII